MLNPSIKTLAEHSVQNDVFLVLAEQHKHHKTAASGLGYKLAVRGKRDFYSNNQFDEAALIVILVINNLSS